MPAESSHSYRKTALVLANAVREGRLRSVFFSGATPGAGTTTAVLEVARQLSGTFGLRALVIELARSRPVYLRKFRFDPAKTLEACAGGRLRASECVQRDNSGLWFLPASADGAASDQNLALPAVLRRVLDEVGADFDLALVDAPPIVEEADFMAVASVIPKMVLVVEAGRTRYDALERIKRALSAQDVTILGAILCKHRQFIPGWIYRWLAQ